MAANSGTFKFQDIVQEKLLESGGVVTRDENVRSLHYKEIELEGKKYLFVSRKKDCTTKKIT